MVRLKQRYILFEILYPSPEDEGAEPELTPSQSLLGLHRLSPATINPKSITQAIRNLVQEYYGDHGASFSMQLNMKYFNNKTSSGILRCGVQNFQYVLAVLPLISRLDDRDVIINGTHVSGTIKKCEDYAIRANMNLMREITSREKIETGKMKEIPRASISNLKS